ncbi:MAG: GMC family oxidoreductase [Hyphomonadaceae bacterium]|nr:GMC family oxidoreductase [Hyphomonadaceae bacterium]
MKFVGAQDTAGPWDVVVVGSGFGSLFFLKRFLALRPRARVLVLERGRHNDAAWQLANNANADIAHDATFVNESGKEWIFTVGLGGSTNCWWALAPRLHPSDFTLKSRHGVGADWPLSYDDLVPYYEDAERIMLVAGPDDLGGVFPGTRGYPQPPHALSTVDEILRRRPGHMHHRIPCARLTRAVEGRGRCCASAVCNLCPTGAKFTALNGLADVLGHPGVSICTEAEVRTLEVAGGRVTGAAFVHAGRDHRVRGDLVVLGANAIFNPWILMRSGVTGGHGLGGYFGEKMYVHVPVLLDGVDGFDGGTASTCFNLARLDTPQRGTMGSVVYYFDNMVASHGLRMTPGRWRQIQHISLYVEDVLRLEDGVVDDGGPMPTVRHAGFSDYAMRGMRAAIDALPDVLAGLPVESVGESFIRPAMGHLQGTTRMGVSAADSVVDADLLHHTHRNLVVVGTSVFPTMGSVNPSLTAAALSLRAAERLAGRLT